MDTPLATSTSQLYHDKCKRPKRIGTPNKKQRFEGKKKSMKEGSAEEVLAMDVRNLLASQVSTSGAEATALELPEPFTALELEILELSSIGDGLALHNGRAYVVPFSLPGDRILAKVIRHLQSHTVTDFLSVVHPSPDRDDSLVQCKYFGSCSGCQLQMLSYPEQLEFKKRVIEKAYDHFSNLPEGILPPIGQTIGSPLQYGYRTKLTPHFDGPRKGGFKVTDVAPEIGFNIKGHRRVLDIEDCPIGVKSVRNGIAMQRKYVHENLIAYKRGATLLLRESTSHIEDGEDQAKFTEEKLCITDPNATCTEYIDSYKFISLAGGFFQNNNSILPTFTAYIRNNLSLAIPTNGVSKEPLRYLVDAYCGSGLFTVTCGSSVQKAIGVDISADSVAYASRNAVANNISNVSFIAGNAEKIFAEIDFRGVETGCIIDPPRKGCDRLFLDQLLEFNPKRIVYVSCVWILSNLLSGSSSVNT